MKYFLQKYNGTPEFSRIRGQIYFPIAEIPSRIGPAFSFFLPLTSPLPNATITSDSPGKWRNIHESAGKLAALRRRAEGFLAQEQHRHNPVKTITPGMPQLLRRAREMGLECKILEL
jgi:hypothetical protein